MNSVRTNFKAMRSATAGVCCGLLAAAAAPVCLAQAAKPGASAPPKVTQIGDIKVSGYQSIVYPPTGAIVVKGPNTMVEAPDKQSGAKFSVHADEIRLIDPLTAAKSQIEMRGSVRYTITQTTPAGERKVSGTAGAADFHRAAHRVILSQGVRAELIDPHLDGPGTLRAASITVDIAAEPYVYNLSGESGTNDIRFTSRQTPANPNAAARNPSAQLGPVHIYRWESGVFQAGKSAKFDGADVTADLKSRSGTPEGQIRARHIEGDFADTGEIARAHAVNDVHYHFERPIERQPAAGKGKPESGRQEVTGTCREATFEPSVGRTTLDGDVDATLVNTLTLAEPASLRAARVTITDAPAAGKNAATQFEILGAPNHRRLAFTPKPTPPHPPAGGTVAAADAPAFSLGSIILLGFEKATYEPGKQVEVVSDGKTPIYLDTSDPKSRSAVHVETRKFTATLAATGDITSAETGGGPVTFHVQQPAPPVKPEAGAASPPQATTAALQELDGTAAKATYKIDDKAHTFSLVGPLNTKIMDPERVQGIVSIGDQGDTFSMDLVTHVMNWDTPANTMSIVVTPLDQAAPANPAPKPAAAKRKK